MKSVHCYSFKYHLNKFNVDFVYDNDSADDDANVSWTVCNKTNMHNTP